MNRKLLALFVSGATVLLLIAGVTTVARADTNGCPNSNSLDNWFASSLVGAHVTTAANAVTYFFDSWVNRTPTDGVPGLIEYCIYPDPANKPDEVVTVAIGADGSAWEDPQQFDNFSFQRTDGNPSNIALDGTTDIELGTATWYVAVPETQVIVLHINDAAECDRLYGTDPGTCFVLPGNPPPPPQVVDLGVTKTATPSFTRTYAWDPTKEADATSVNIADGGLATFNYTVSVTHDDGTDSGWQVDGTITVSNPNAFEVDGVVVSDAVDNGGTCLVNGAADFTVDVPAGDSVPVSYVCSYSSEPDPLDGTNTASITWPDIGSPNTSADSAGVPVDFSTTDPTLVNDEITVTDSLGGTLGTVSYTDPSPTEFKYSKEFPGVGGTCTEYDNTATITETQQSTDKVTVTVCVGLDPTVEKTATPSFKRTYDWGITKDVDKTLVELIGGGSATFHYTANAAQTGFTDSDWQVGGTITISNPNDWEAITLTDLTDVVDNGGVCTVDAGPYTVLAGDTLDVGYTCTYASAPDPANGTNTATATWDKAAYYTPTGSADGTKDFAFGEPTTLVNRTITVTDTFNGGTPVTLGTLTGTDAQPWASASFTYSQTVVVPTADCVKYTNVAKIVETGQTATRTVEVCGPARTGALTMGFWQNKNGQMIITSYGGGSPGGTCNLATWLRTYNPYKDLSATSTCPQVTTYVFNIVKAANASGASMNAMLKAQMLATALDVYFSDPALGGNRILAPAPIGNVWVDLTKVCKNIPTCTVFEVTMQAFNNYPQLAVKYLLWKASLASDAGGSMWYFNFKPLQERAKDTFDAINNRVIFAP